MFTGFPEETIRFFLDLRFHNNAVYFNENRERYRQEVVAPFSAFIDELAPAMLAIDPQMEVRPTKCLARIHRDTRFTKDKSPYRDHLWLTFRRVGEPRSMSVNYWFELGPDQLGWGLGFWGENRPVMDALRQKIAARPEQILGIIDSCNLPEHHLGVGGTTFKRIEYPPKLPEQLKYWYAARELYIGKVYPEMSWAFDASIVRRVQEDFQVMAPLYRLMRGLQEEIDEQL